MTVASRLVARVGSFEAVADRNVGVAQLVKKRLETHRNAIIRMTELAFTFAQE
jgi:hypothetical protein